MQPEDMYDVKGFPVDRNYSVLAYKKQAPNDTYDHANHERLVQKSFSCATESPKTSMLKKSKSCHSEMAVSDRVEEAVYDGTGFVHDRNYSVLERVREDISDDMYDHTNHARPAQKSSVASGIENERIKDAEESMYAVVEDDLSTIVSELGTPLNRNKHLLFTPKEH